MATKRPQETVKLPLTNDQLSMILTVLEDTNGHKGSLCCDETTAQTIFPCSKKKAATLQTWTYESLGCSDLDYVTCTGKTRRENWHEKIVNTLGEPGEISPEEF